MYRGFILRECNDGVSYDILHENFDGSGDKCNIEEIEAEARIIREKEEEKIKQKIKAKET